MRKWWMGALAALACLAVAGAATAQDYPSKPVRVVVQYAAGGGADLLARLLSQELSNSLGQSLVVENRAGANGAIANAFVAGTPPDGYTLLFGAAGSLVISPHIYGSQTDNLKDFTPIILAASSPFALAVHPSVKAASLAELTALAKASPGKLNFGSSGNGGSPHLAGELYKNVAGVDIVHVPYKGLAPAIADLVGGQIQMIFADVGLLKPHIGSGAVRPLAVTGAKRSSALPDLPTMAEAGLPGYQANTWYGFFAPTGTPASITRKIHAETTKALAVPAVRERIASQGLEIGGGPSEQFAQYVRDEYAKWARLVKDAKIKAE